MNLMEATTKRRVLLLVKLVLTAAVLYLLARKILGQENAESLRERVRTIDVRWLVPALVAQLAMVLVGTVRWQKLLEGQGIRPTFRHLLGSMMIGRYFGAVTPAGLGFQGFRIYDIATRTNKPARATATVGVEVIAGQLGFFSVLLVGSAFGSKYIDPSKLAVIDAGLLCVIAAGVVFLSKPTLVAHLARAVLGAVPTRIQGLVEAVCAYAGQSRRLVLVVGLSTLIHVGHNFVYFFAARALGVHLSVGEIFFATSMQILSTFAPITINGVGVREATAVAFYTSVGVPAVVAALIATVGFLVEMLVSVAGGPIFLARRQSYSPVIEVDDPEREDRVEDVVAHQAVELPSVLRGALIGLAGGLFAGVLIGLAEAVVVLKSSTASHDYGVLWYGVVAYGIVCGGAGTAGGLGLAWLGRLIRRGRTEEAVALGRWVGGITAGFGFVLGVFRIRRDVFDEELIWKSKQGVMVLGGSLLTALLVYVILSSVFRWLGRRRSGGGARLLAHPVFALGVVGAVVASLVGVARANPLRAHASTRTIPDAPMQAGNVLFIVVDTLRADHLPAYGYTNGHTPNLDQFANDAVRFDQHFANASWTRPSFASILSGRYVASHRVMSKDDALPAEITTMPEALAASGYRTGGIVTNFNVTSYFQFDQGFDTYAFLEPAFVLGANDAQAKLLIVQIARRVIERFTPARPGTAYRDAATVNRHVIDWVRHAPDDHPFFMFAAYMDPHDPYYVHPYDGTPGYARATHQNPDADDAEHLRALYDGEIAYWDTQFGQLVAELRRLGLYDRMTIIITADHGEEFMDHGGFWHGTTLYDEQIRVPLLVKLPFAARGGEVISAWSQSIDLMPSILAHVGAEPVRGPQGRSDLFDAGFVGSTDVLAEESHEGNVLSALRARRGRSETKLILANEGNPRGLGTTELFRMDLDPGEHVNLAADDPTLAALLQARHAEDARLAARGRVTNRTQVSLGAHRESLQAIGYAGDTEQRRPTADAGTPAPVPAPVPAP